MAAASFIQTITLSQETIPDLIETIVAAEFSAGHTQVITEVLTNAPSIAIFTRGVNALTRSGRRDDARAVLRDVANAIAMGENEEQALDIDIVNPRVTII